MVKPEAPSGAVFLGGDAMSSGDVPAQRHSLPAVIEADHKISASRPADRYGGSALERGFHRSPEACQCLVYCAKQGGKLIRIDLIVAKEYCDDLGSMLNIQGCINFGHLAPQFCRFSQ